MPNSKHERDVAFPIPPKEIVELDKHGRRVSKWARWSLRFSIYSFSLVLLIILLLFGLDLIPKVRYFYVTEIVLSLLILLILILALIALLTGITGLTKIAKSKGRLTGFGKAVTGVVLSLILISPVLAMQIFGPYLQRNIPVWKCQHNLKQLYSGFEIYYRQNNKKTYPSQEKWCDELLKIDCIYTTSFRCYGADPNYYESETCFSHYAMNPDCEPNSPGDVVLLFDTQPGWNQHGGAELLAPENHRGKNCNILFNDGTVKFIKKKHFDHLRWK